MTGKSPSCYDENRLQQFLNEQLDELDESCVMEHIDGCPECQLTLEKIAANRSTWDDLKFHLAGHLGVDPGEDTIAIVERDRDMEMERLQSYLGPTDNPDMLGRLGTYEVCGLVGRGSTGVVVKALEPRLNRYVAIKVLSPSFSSNGPARARFEREARAVAAVSHEHVVPIFAVDEYRGLPFIVMQYVPGGSLLQRIEGQGPLNTTEVVRLGMQIAKGLAAAHEQGIVHRDVKPANVLLESKVDRAMVSDFGLARVADEAAMTRSGVIAGTPQFMSPEQAKGEPIDQRSDLFSLGSVMYHAATGRPPFRAETVFGVIQRVCMNKPTAVRDINPDIEIWLEGFINKLHEKNRDDRFNSAEQVSHILSKELAYLQGPAISPQPERPWFKSKKSVLTGSRSKLAWLAIAVSVIAMAVVGFKMMPESASSNANSLLASEVNPESFAMQEIAPRSNRSIQIREWPVATSRLSSRSDTNVFPESANVRIDITHTHGVIHDHVTAVHPENQCEDELTERMIIGSFDLADGSVVQASMNHDELLSIVRDRESIGRQLIRRVAARNFGNIDYVYVVADDLLDHFREKDWDDLDWGDFNWGDLVQFGGADWACDDKCESACEDECHKGCKENCEQHCEELIQQHSDPKQESPKTKSASDLDLDSIIATNDFARIGTLYGIALRQEPDWRVDKNRHSEFNFQGETLTKPVIPKGNLVVKAAQGSIEIMTHDKDQVILEWSAKVMAEDKAEAEQLFAKAIVTQPLEEFELDPETDAAIELSFEEEFAKQHGPQRFREIKLILTVPEEFNVLAMTMGGNLQISNIKGDVKFETSGGDITLGEIAGHATAITSGGDVILVRASESSRLTTSGGNIEIESVDAETVVRTLGGQIRLGMVSAPITAETSGGMVKASIADGIEGDVTLKTSGGSIDILLSRNGGYHVSAKSMVGGVHAPFLQKKKSNVDMDINDGGTKVIAETTAGPVTFEYYDDVP